jgi:predicted amidohydrolase YtcJ
MLLSAGFASAAAPAGCKPSGARPARPPADAAAEVMVLGGRIETLDPARPTAQALAISGGRIVAIGDEADVAPMRTAATRVLDLQGGTAVPGLVDAHAHLSGLGRSLEEVDLRGATSIEEVVARLRARAGAGEWLLGRGWDQNLWPGQAMPHHAALDAAFPDRPVWLRRVDGHAGWANAATLRASGIGPSTQAPAGGEILRDDEGAPTGVLVDAAMALVRPPSPTRADLRRHLLAAQRHVLALGLTGVHDMGVDAEVDAIYRELATAEGEDALAIQVIAYADEGWFRGIAGTRRPDPVELDTLYALRGVKVYADGALGSRGAALLAPYSDRPDHRGLLQHQPAELDALCRDAAAGGWQVATHAIGDLGNRATLDAYARARAPKDARWRIEHCQIVALDDIGRFAELGVIASMQPTHATSDMAWVPARIGDARLPGAYAWRRFLDAGVVLAFGSDFPVELPDVVHGLHAAVTRQDATGQPEGGWLPDQRLQLREAIAAFSTAPAYAAHRDAHLGRLAPGMRADVTCLQGDVFAAPAEALRTTAVRATIVAGHVLHEA